MFINKNNFQLSLLKKEESLLFFNLIDCNRTRLEDFFAGTVSKTKDLDSTLKYCVLIQEKILRKEYFPFVIKDLDTNNLIGLIDVKNINWSIPKAELGCFIDTKYANTGVASSFLSTFVNELAKEYYFKKLLCRISPNNISSIRLALKSGFQLEGKIRNDYKTTSGQLVDLNYYGKVF